jgi:hypothetical protein
MVGGEEKKMTWPPNKIPRSATDHRVLILNLVIDSKVCDELGNACLVTIFMQAQ